MEDSSSLSSVAEWTVEAVSDKIRERYNDEIAKKFEGKHNLLFVDHFPGLLPLNFPADTYWTDLS